MKIAKPTIKDINSIRSILSQWTDIKEVEKYIKRIRNEVKGSTEFGMHFWIIRDVDCVVGIGGLSDILPSIKHFAVTDNPGEIKIMYLDNKFRNQGFGKVLINFLEDKARKMKYTELLIRSAKKYKKTAYSFYRKMGYKDLGLTSNNMNVFAKKYDYKD